jgi:riboflavin kinase/FMN adenylyltransferase
MQHHYHSFDSINLNTSAITIGAFDGIHLGHQKIIHDLVDYAQKNHTPSVVITFFPHPAAVLRELNVPFYLTFPDQRASMLFDLGVDYVITLQFTKSLSNFSPEQFMEWLYSHLHHEYLCIGEDFALGKGRKGTPPVLKSIGESLGYILKTIPPEFDGGEKISSSRIRDLIRAGDIQEANRLLGKSYKAVTMESRIDNNCVSDHSIATINFSTRDLQLLPPPGIYAAKIQLVNTILSSIVEVNPMVDLQPSDQDPYAITAHILRPKIPLTNTNLTQVEFLYPLKSRINLSSESKTMTEDIKKQIQKISGKNDK